MDTEFPGVIFKADFKQNKFKNPNYLDDHYKLLKANVDSLNLIQLGLTLSDVDGNLPDFGGSERFIWQFNFCDFDPAHDPHAPDSIELLARQGIDFDLNRIYGVDSRAFAYFMLASGVVCNKSVTWVTFHSAYDFAYLVKILTRRPLPGSVRDFLAVTRWFFGDNVYDLKHLLRFVEGGGLYGGLERVAATVDVRREAGKSHQAGSDSLLTWQAFQKIRDLYFLKGGAAKHAGVLFGLEVS
ncbi:hypothetical protein Leryth_012109 [Lithospermum erythrorhizon]|nr:hypothetical protein Leryth_012109 [Lithospermum erythrorhizon]